MTGHRGMIVGGGDAVHAHRRRVVAAGDGDMHFGRRAAGAVIVGGHHLEAVAQGLADAQRAVVARREGVIARRRVDADMAVRGVEAGDVVARGVNQAVADGITAIDVGPGGMTGHRGMIVGGGDVCHADGGGIIGAGDIHRHGLSRGTAMAVGHRHGEAVTDLDAIAQSGGGRIRGKGELARRRIDIHRSMIGRKRGNGVVIGIGAEGIAQGVMNIDVVPGHMTGGQAGVIRCGGVHCGGNGGRVVGPGNGDVHRRRRAAGAVVVGRHHLEAVGRHVSDPHGRRGLAGGEGIFAGGRINVNGAVIGGDRGHQRTVGGLQMIADRIAGIGIAGRDMPRGRRHIGGRGIVVAGKARAIIGDGDVHGFGAAGATVIIDRHDLEAVGQGLIGGDGRIGRRNEGVFARRRIDGHAAVGGGQAIDLIAVAVHQMEDHGIAGIGIGSTDRTAQLDVIIRSDGRLCGR